MGVAIRIYDLPTADRPTIMPVGYTQAAAYVKIQQNFYTPGSFEIRIQTGTRYADQLRKYRAVKIGDFTGIIDELKIEEEGARNITTVTGWDLKGILANRITVPPQYTTISGTAGFDAVTGSTETCIKHFVENNITAALQTGRNVPGFVVAEDQQRGRPDDKYMSRFELLSEVVRKLGEDAKIGYDVTLDLENHHIVFDVLEPTVRTAEQTDVPPIVFEKDRRNVLSLQYSSSDASLKNIFYATMAGAEFEDDALTMTYWREDEEETTGLRRRETHMEITAESPTPGQEYDELKRLALVQANDLKDVETLECGITDVRYQYGRDYFLGDFVTVRDREIGIVMHTQITGMTTEYSGASVRRSAVFGDQKISVARRLLQLLNR